MTYVALLPALIRDDVMRIFLKVVEVLTAAGTSSVLTESGVKSLFFSEFKRSAHTHLLD